MDVLGFELGPGHSPLHGLAVNHKGFNSGNPKLPERTRSSGPVIDMVLPFQNSCVLTQCTWWTLTEVHVEWTRTNPPSSKKQKLCRWVVGDPIQGKVADCTMTSLLSSSSAWVAVCRYCVQDHIPHHPYIQVHKHKINNAVFSHEAEKIQVLWQWSYSDAACSQRKLH